MDLEHLMLSEISQIEKDKYCILYVESKKIKLVKNTPRNRVKWWLPRNGEWGDKIHGV